MMPRPTRYDNLGTQVDRYTIRNIACAYVALIFSSLVFFGCMVVIVLITQYNYPIKWTFGVYVIGTSSLYLTNFASSVHMLFGKKPTRPADRNRRERELRACSYFPMTTFSGNDIAETSNNEAEQQSDVHVDFSDANSVPVQQSKTPPPPYEDLDSLQFERTANASCALSKEMQSRVIEVPKNDTRNHNPLETFIEINSDLNGETHRKGVTHVDDSRSIRQCTLCRNPFELGTSDTLLDNMSLPFLNITQTNELTFESPEKNIGTKTFLGVSDQDEFPVPEYRRKQPRPNLLRPVQNATNAIPENSFQDLHDIKNDKHIKAMPSRLSIGSSPPDLIRSSAKPVKRYSKTKRDRKHAETLRDKASGIETNNKPVGNQTKATRLENNYWEQPQDLVLSKTAKETFEQTEIASHRPLQKSMTAPDKGFPFQQNSYNLTAPIPQQTINESPLSPNSHTKLLGTVSEGSGIYQNLSPQEWIVAWDRSLSKISGEDASRTFGARV